MYNANLPCSRLTGKTVYMYNIGNLQLRHVEHTIGKVQ